MDVFATVGSKAHKTRDTETFVDYGASDIHAVSGRRYGAGLVHGIWHNARGGEEHRTKGGRDRDERILL